MKRPLHPLLLSLIMSMCAGSKGHAEHLTRDNLTMSLLPANFHKENTVTNDWIPEGEEDEDYLDLEKLLSEDDDYIYVVDAVSPTDSESSAESILQLFQGKSRIQRLNILNAKFAFNLYRALKDQATASDNVIIAPAGISIAMAMISLGLRGQTHEEVHSVLHFKDFVNASSKYEITTIHNLFRKLTHRLFRRNFGYTLQAVNELYIQKQFPIREGFRAAMREFYFAEAREADFSDPAFTAKADRHILRLTKGLIREALQNIDPATQMMILNCIYFKGKKPLYDSQRKLTSQPPGIQRVNAKSCTIAVS
ncbi:heparin cofactor 2-like [Acomys russatus]|uniref:heparin cofactor 2-like n=1 Tax=Acomys russatus TaxID=60746 RepID=UPI0021E220F8|nr:heparin cofactor 2-like [Acomys russatus]